MPGQPIVVGVDGSPESAVAVSAGWLLAQAAGVDCRPVHAAHDVRAALLAAGDGVSVDAVELALLAHARHDVRATIADRVPARVADQLIVRRGRAPLVLDDVIAETNAQLLVLGGKHHSTLGRWLGGSTVQHVVRRLGVPLLVTTRELPARARVMVALDSSYAAQVTLNHAVALAQLLGGPLHALHVIEPAVALSEAAMLGDANHEAQARERMERDIWPLLPIPDHHKVIRSGPATPTIVQEAEAWRADIIVVGSHGKRWIDRLLIGSVTDDLLNDLPAAVLVIPVPAPLHAQPAPARLRTAMAPA
jgi:nucleotide-binding universal stress UspA family protein